jgi:hypothetical protein
MAEQGIQVSKARVNELLTNQYLTSIAQLQQQVAELTAVNEALMERIRGYSGGSTPEANGKALSEGIDASDSRASG